MIKKGQKFKSLETVKRYLVNEIPIWDCRCECGRTLSILESALLDGTSKCSAKCPFKKSYPPENTAGNYRFHNINLTVLLQFKKCCLKNNILENQWLESEMKKFIEKHNE